MEAVYHKRGDRGFTLVELLVVIAIVGTLIALLLPAIQAAREAARNTECKNHLKQLGVATHLFHDAMRRLPSQPVAVGELTFGGIEHPKSPYPGFEEWPGFLSWVWGLFPFIEEFQATVKSGVSVNGIEAPKPDDRMHQLPVELMNCPTRRRAQPYPVPKFGIILGGGTPVDLPGMNTATRSDYAANGGDLGGAAATTMLHRMWTACTGTIAKRKAPEFAMPVSMREVTDGLSKTYLFGEKYMDPNHYESGEDFGDIGPMLMSVTFGTVRFGDRSIPPARDAAGKGDPRPFGSAHPGAWNVVLCDGSVRAIAYTIDPVMHGRLANRRDDQVIDDSAF